MSEATPPPEAVETPPQPAAAAPEAEVEEVARDWLDHLYAASRFGVLLSLFWLYGSPARLLLVVLLAAAGYLHQIGFFRDLHVNPANNQPRRNVNQNPGDSAAPPAQPVNEEQRNQRSLLAVSWMIFTSFFASLIPDTN